MNNNISSNISNWKYNWEKWSQNKIDPNTKLCHTKNHQDRTQSLCVKGKKHINQVIEKYQKYSPA